MSIERVEHEGETIALIVRGDFEEEGAKFFTNDDNPLQLGVINQKAGQETQPHVHREREVAIKSIQEVVHVDRGRALVKFYTRDGNKVGSRILERGDTILLMNGGHGFRMLEDTRLVEIKQGPYDESNTVKIEV